ncbi:hypothetical protein F2P81_009403 [Scophthalmus maximus]|uniref:Uncharacterized protein n=1 Tax=Scophthalmus maximus TaxID=52904 RepID=A0A6A4T1P6_SCOMX|nr:hypothetical protein F2P81_009403 [Scophthalmus maximus]
MCAEPLRSGAAALWTASAQRLLHTTLLTVPRTAAQLTEQERTAAEAENVDRLCRKRVQIEKSEQFRKHVRTSFKLAPFACADLKPQRNMTFIIFTAQ